jgi:hypothetical protein
MCSFCLENGFDKDFRLSSVEALTTSLDFEHLISCPLGMNLESIRLGSTLSTEFILSVVERTQDRFAHHRSLRACPELVEGTGLGFSA